MARRHYGTGSLRQVGQSWIGSWYGPDDRRIKRRIGSVRTSGGRDGLTKAQAEKEFARLRESEAVLAASTRRVTMQEAGAELCKVLELRGRKKSHRLTVAADLRNHIEPFFEGKDLAKITPQEIERYVVVKRKSLAIKTVRNHLNTIHSVFELGLRRKWCQINPVKLAERPVIRTTETRIKFLDQPELEQLLAVKYPKDAFGGIEATLYLTAAMTGLRQGELLELRHTFGTRMAAAGVPLRTIQHWMGHADAKTTQVYAHYQPSDHEADTVDQAFEVSSRPRSPAGRPGRARSRRRAGSRG